MIELLLNLRKLLGYCPSCQRWFKWPKRFKTNTAYIDEASNYGFGCKDCQRTSDAYWDDMWANLY